MDLYKDYEEEEFDPLFGYLDDDDLVLDVESIDVGELTNRELLMEILEYVDKDGYDSAYANLEQQLFSRLLEAKWLDDE